MDGILAQYIAIGLHGSAWLHDRDGPSGLEATNSTFRYLSQLRFESLTGDTIETVDGWLATLAGSEVTRVDLAMPVGPAGDPTSWRKRSAFVDDHPEVGLWVETSEGARLWRARWRTKNRNPLVAPPPDPKPWYVTYREWPADTAVERPALPTARQALIDALGLAIDYARAQGMDPFDTKLAQARELDTAADPQPPYHADMAPAGRLSPDRRRLLAMATAAHVFGGMGTWNDRGFGDPDAEREYDAVSDQLFMAVMRSFAAVVNTV